MHIGAEERHDHDSLMTLIRIFAVRERWQSSHPGSRLQVVGAYVDLQEFS
jgi:hypothetical protein